MIKKKLLVTHSQFRDFQRNKWFLKTNTQNEKQNEHIPMEFEFLSSDHKKTYWDSKLFTN